MNWPVKKLEEVAEITSSKRVFKNEYVPEGIPFYRTKEIAELSQSKNISLDLYISEKRFNEIGNKFGIPNIGDILISAVGTIGISWIIPDDRKFYFKDGNLLWIKNFRGVNSSYIKFFLDYSFNSVSKLAAGGAYKALTIINLKKFQVLIPDILKQQKIVERLDAIRKAQEFCDQQIQKTEELFESILHNEVKSSGIEVLFPEATDFQEGPGILAKDFRNSGTPLVRLKGTIGPEVTLEGCNYLNPLMVKQKWHHFVLKKGDLLLTTSASLGQVSEVTDVAEGTITYTGIIRFRPNEKLLDKGYLKYFLSSELFKSQARNAATGGVIKHFGPTHIKKMKLFLPSLKNQQRIVGKLEAVQNYKKLLQEEKTLLKELFDSVLDKSMKGELDS